MRLQIFRTHLLSTNNLFTVEDAIELVAKLKKEDRLNIRLDVEYKIGMEEPTQEDWQEWHKAWNALNAMNKTPM